MEVEERLAEVAGGGGGVAGGSRRRRGRTAASGWEETRDKVDKVGWAVFMGLSMHLYSCSLLFVFFFCEVIRVYTCICETPRSA